MLDWIISATGWHEKVYGCRTYILHPLGKEDHPVGKGMLQNILGHLGVLSCSWPFASANTTIH